MYTDIQSLQIAMNMEQRGIELYTRAARLAKGEKLRTMLASLAEDERNHAAQFRRMAERCAPDAGPDELAAAVAADIAFPGGLFRAAAGGCLENEKRLLEYAMESERSSIAFYTELRDAAEDEETKRTLSDIIRQEQGHLKQLTDRRDEGGHRE